MGCAGCTTSANGKPNGCRSNGNCSCNRLNTFDWLSQMGIADVDPMPVVEVSFKNGARKGFYHLPDYLHVLTGEDVVVETGNGHDLGRVSLSGELVRLQMRKKKVPEDARLHKVVRTANERDLERLQEARDQEVPTMIRARAIARSLSLEMKIGDVEYQADKRKATFYYTADGRVDFRELIRHYAREFRVKIEMRQIGARQESARIGGLGSCGRELCCSTWLTDFKSVSTSAARYQNLAINQSKLSGQCGRLKCCLNYELDTYLDALEDFPKKADRLDTQMGRATLIKTDVFKRLMYYVLEREGARSKFYALSVNRVKEILEANARGEKVTELQDLAELVEETPDYEDVTGVVELPDEKRKRGKNRRRGRSKRSDKAQNRKEGRKSGGRKKRGGGGKKKGGPDHKDT